MNSCSPLCPQPTEGVRWPCVQGLFLLDCPSSLEVRGEGGDGTIEWEGEDVMIRVR